MTRVPKPSGRRSKAPAAIFVPRVRETAWQSAAGPIPGAWIEIPANRAGLFVSAENLRGLADQLHDLADEIEDR